MTTATAAVEEAALPPSTPDPQDECVLCCYPFPLELNESVYHECCGEVICWGCIIAQKRTLKIGTNVKQPIAGSKEEEEEFMMILSNASVEEEDKVILVCPFCRAKKPTNDKEGDKEHIKRLWTRIDEYEDPKAMNMMGVDYTKGDHGLSKNFKKAEALLKRSYDLGNPSAAVNLFVLHRDHVPDEARMTQYAEEGARRGDVKCMNTLAKRAAQSGNLEEAVRQYMTAACSGHEEAMQNLMKVYRHKLLSKEALATTLRAHKVANDNANNESREYANRYEKFLKKKIVELRGNRSLVAE